MGGGETREGDIKAPFSAQRDFKPAARPLTEDDKLFLHAYREKDLGHSNMTVDAVNSVAASKSRPPEVEEAFRKVLEHPGQYGLKAEDHSWLVQKAFGVPKVDFTSTGYQAGVIK